VFTQTVILQQLCALLNVALFTCEKRIAAVIVTKLTQTTAPLAVTIHAALLLIDYFMPKCMQDVPFQSMIKSYKYFLCYSRFAYVCIMWILSEQIYNK